MRPSPTVRWGGARGFSLIEMIGVLAIMAIVAGVLVPNVLRSLDRAAIRAEAETLAALGDQTKLFVRVNGVPPAPGTWSTDLGTLADLAPVDIARNRRAIARLYLLDPAATPAPRAMILSCMRPGITLPAAADISTPARFQSLWQTADSAVPSTASWGGWAGWTAVANSAEHLVIERINLSPIYHSEWATVTLSLNHRGTTTASYNVVLASGAAQAAINIAAGGTVVLTGVQPRTRLNLYRAAAGAGLDYTYVVGTNGRTFDFDGIAWNPQ